MTDDGLLIYRQRDGSYERHESPWFPELRLGLMLWEGVFEAVWSRWLRWTDEHGTMIPTGRERAEQAERLLAQERRRADRLSVLLRRSGIDPEQK